MDETEMQAEKELSADLDSMAHAVQEGVQSGRSPAVWMEYREQIAGFRGRIRTMRDRHLGESCTSSMLTRQ